MSVSDDMARMVMNSGKMMWSIDEVRRGLSRIGRIPECNSERGPWKRVGDVAFCNPSSTSASCQI